MVEDLFLRINFSANPFNPNAPFLYPLKKTFRFSDVFRRWKKGALGTNKLNTDSRCTLFLLLFQKSDLSVLPLLLTEL